MSASPNSLTSNVVETNLPTFNPSSSINLTKLTRLNYPTWKATMLPYLKGQKVYEYIDGTVQQPTKTITASDGSTTPNPSYDIWETQDNLILSCINSSFSDEVLAQVAHCSTSAKVWMALSFAFVSQSRAKAVYVHSQFFTLRKARIQHNNQILSFPMALANVATRQQHFSRGRGRGNLSASQGRGRNPFNGNCGGGRCNTSLWCQPCKKPGHMASRCWKRFDPHFQTPLPRLNP
ncbi:hypothetical protein F0562_035780 [Nyssa sinensis]|uniref:Uncharacterized protein n=1 Tax=Nyssa sinensis TaxID=561372 RepID=A0A5J5ABN8_9ASTE|nr:hypothetical protein F0562_035780 [Nyssa sinensis]